MGKWSGSFSSTVKFATVSGTPNFKLKVQLLQPDGVWLDVPDLTWLTIDQASSVTSCSSSNADKYFFFSTVFSKPFWAHTIYNKIRWKIVFTGAQSIKLWHMNLKY